MFNRKEKSKRKTVEKVLMGVIIGGAIGSVLGASIAPQEGKETRKEIVDAAKKAKGFGFRLFHKIKEKFFRKKEPKKETPENPL